MNNNESICNYESKGFFPKEIVVNKVAKYFKQSPFERYLESSNFEYVEPVNLRYFKCAGIYILVNIRTRKIDYVGCSKQLNRRLNENSHRRYIKDTHAVVLYLLDDEYIDNIYQIENNFITVLNPELNRKYETFVFEEEPR